nr:Chain P, 10-meric peptide from Genome polyprotein [Hepacivirus hominis]
LLFNILGGWV